MTGADVFALTSLLDGTSCVLNEAVSLALPIICNRFCGFPDVIDETCGILVPVVGPKQSYRGFANALRRFANDTTFYNRMADGALARAELRAGNSPGEKMAAVYNRVLSGTADGSSVEGIAQLAEGITWK
jgi:glycosyltransferase involved in cell wall biosynthesis